VQYKQKLSAESQTSPSQRPAVMRGDIKNESREGWHIQTKSYART